MLRLRLLLVVVLVSVSGSFALGQAPAAKPGEEFNNEAIKNRKKPVVKPAATLPARTPASKPGEPAAKSEAVAKPGDVRPDKTVKKPTVPPIPKELADGSTDAWTDYFEKNRPAPQAVARYVLELEKARKYDHLVALIEAALLNGQSQPWMFEVLAVGMEKLKRPPAEIERVLLSNVDFQADVPTLVYSATFLANSGRDARALQLCRQASKIDPTRPEPYGLGLNLAIKLNDPEAIAWGAAGCLSRVWTKNYASYHEMAERAAADTEAQLRKAGKKAEADRLTAAVAEARQRDLVVELTWSGDADLELIVEEPNGSVCQFNRSRTTGGGVFVHDGYGPDPKNTYEKYLCPRGMSGKYRIIVRHLWGNVVGKKAELKITRYQGTPNEATETFFPQTGAQDKVYNAPLNNGRLKEPLPPPVMDDLLAEKPRRRQRPNLLAMAKEQARVQETARRVVQQGGQLARSAAPVGFQPIISVINDGVNMSAQAVVSADRRYVRLTLAPVFSAITDVQTFSFFQGGANQQPLVTP